MSSKAPTLPHARIPQFGVIEGGLLDGWRFGFQHLEVQGRSGFLVINATQPNWCFPTLVRLNARTDFKRLRNPGEISPYHDTNKLIERELGAQLE